MNLNLEKCYEILGLPLRASLREIKTAYRTLAKKWHPDLFYGIPKKQREGEEKLKLFNAAYDFLTSNHAESFAQEQEVGKSTQQRNEENRRARAADEAKQREENHVRAEQEAKRSAKRKEKARGRELRKAFEKFHKLAKRGIAEAQYRVATFYKNGQGCVRNKDEAMLWFKKAAIGFEKAAAGGDPQAMLYLGFAFAWGIGGTTEVSKAIKLYEAAAKKGLAEANFHLGFMYYFGYGVSINFETAVKFYHKAIEHGYKVSDSDTCDHFRIETPKKYFKQYKWYVLGVQRASF